MTRTGRCAIPALPCPDATERPSPAATGTGAVSGEGAGPSSSTGASTTRSSDSGPCPTERFAAAPARRPHGAAAAAGPSPRSSRWTGSGNCVRPIARLSCAPRSERAPACSTGARAPADCGATVKKTAPPNRRSTPPASEESRRAPALWRTAQTLVVYRVRSEHVRGLALYPPGCTVVDAVTGDVHDDLPELGGRGAVPVVRGVGTGGRGIAGGPLPHGHPHRRALGMIQALRAAGAAHGSHCERQPLRAANIAWRRHRVARAPPGGAAPRNVERSGDMPVRQGAVRAGAQDLRLRWWRPT